MMSNRLINGADLVISFDDFNPLNIRLAELLNEYGLLATFYIETAQKESLEQIRHLYSLGHDIGGHTIHHPADIKQISIVEARGEIEACKRMIELEINDECTSFAYPRGRYNEDIIFLVKQAGYKDARTTKVLNYETPVDLFQVDTTIHIYSGRKEYKGHDWLSLAKDYLGAAIDKKGVFHIWGHAWEIDRDNEWDNLKNFLDHVVKFLDKDVAKDFS